MHFANFFYDTWHEELRQQSFYARSDTGVVFFNQEDAMHVTGCVAFRFSKR